MRACMVVSGLVLSALCAEATATEAEPPLNVLLITVDNLRPANMGVYGYERDTTPALSALAEESVVFTHAFATTAWTSPGINSLFTGYHPPTHGQNGPHSWWDPTVPTALTLLGDAGYRTTGRTNQGPTLANIGFQLQVAPYADLEGFIANRSHPGLIDRPFYGWMHLKEVHLPYKAGSAYHRRLWGAHGYDSPAVRSVLKNSVLYLGQQDFEFSERDKEVTRALYDASVAAVDARIGEAVEEMRRVGLLDRTILVISADHGEELFEHGWLGHASTSWDGRLFEANLRVPLIVRLPGGASAGRVDAMVSQVDLMPTLMELLEVPTDGLVLPMQGRSLLPLIRGETDAPPHPYVYAQTTYKGWATPLDEMSDRLTAVRSETLKLLRYGGARGDALVGYDLVADPAEQEPLAAASDARFQPLIDALAAWDEETRAGAATLSLAAAERQAERQRAALATGDVREVMAAYSDLLLLDQTHRIEVTPFMNDPRWSRDWRRALERARDGVARAVRSQ